MESLVGAPRFAQTDHLAGRLGFQPPTAFATAATADLGQVFAGSRVHFIIISRL